MCRVEAEQTVFLFACLSHSSCVFPCCRIAVITFDRTALLLERYFLNGTLNNDWRVKTFSNIFNHFIPHCKAEVFISFSLCKSAADECEERGPHMKLRQQKSGDTGLQRSGSPLGRKKRKWLDSLIESLTFSQIAMSSDFIVLHNSRIL